MTKKLFIHVGPRKTATSTIQGFLRDHDNSTVIYPKAGLWNDGSHHGLVFSFFDDPRKKVADVERLFEDIAGEVRSFPGKNVLISSEELSRDKDISAFVRALLPFIDVAPVGVEILIACREHFGRAASLHNHRLRFGYRGSPDTFLRKKAESLCYGPLLQEAKKTGFKFTGLNYHVPNWVESFLCHVGFLEGASPRPDKKLVSLSRKITVAKLAINRVAKSERKNQEYTRAFMALPESRKSSEFIFGPQAALEAERLFAPDRRLIAGVFEIKLVRPDLEKQENMLFITPEEFQEISSVAHTLGPKAREIAQFAKSYIRGGPAIGPLGKAPRQGAATETTMTGGFVPESARIHFGAGQ